MMEPWGIHWFRRDLRIFGNLSLRENFKQHSGRVLGVFCFDSKFLERPDFSHIRFSFFLKTLAALKEEFQAQGGELLVVNAEPREAFSKIFYHFEKKAILRPRLISWNRDYEPYARDRDAKVSEFLERQGLEVLTRRDHLILEPNEVLKGEKAHEFYQVYSPFSRKWFLQLSSNAIQARLQEQSGASHYLKNLKLGKSAQSFQMKWAPFTGDSEFPFQDALKEFQEKNDKNVSIPIPEAGFSHAIEAVNFFKDGVPSYKEKRDFPGIAGTSRLSIYLKNGSLASSQILERLELGGIDGKKEGGATQFTKEIAWREFYYSILFHRPDVETSNFLRQYNQLKWENNQSHFERWKEGTTGFPIIDAGMRELKETGWMHNRVRMIVASFLTKDLLIDWRWGERHFMKFLLDGDLAPNNGGWQWAASTGCDPQPYFRVFNPWLQSEKFDRDGNYIKTYVPELRNAPAKILHDPDADRSQWKYPKPMVDHSIQRVKAIALFKTKINVPAPMQ